MPSFAQMAASPVRIICLPLSPTSIRLAVPGAVSCVQPPSILMFVLANTAQSPRKNINTPPPNAAELLRIKLLTILALPEDVTYGEIRLMLSKIRRAEG